MINNHSIVNVLVHFVFVTKWRKNCAAPLASEVRILEICKNLNCNLIDWSYDRNHYHMLIELHSSISSAVFACKMKSLLSGWLARNFPDWNCFQTGYYAASCSATSFTKILNYIRSQSL